MNSNIQEEVFEMLDNAVDNGYPHEYNKKPEHYIAEMVEQSGRPEINNTNELSSACDAVRYWRLVNKEKNNSRN